MSIAFFALHPSRQNAEGCATFCFVGQVFNLEGEPCIASPRRRADVGWRRPSSVFRYTGLVGTFIRVRIFVDQLVARQDTPREAQSSTNGDKEVHSVAPLRIVGFLLHGACLPYAYVGPLEGKRGPR